MPKKRERTGIRNYSRLFRMKMIPDLSSIMLEIDYLTKSFPSRLCTPSSVKRPIKDDIASIFAYVASNQSLWAEQLAANQESSLFLRASEANLPFSIEYWATGQCVAYTKALIDTGGYKRVYLAIDLTNVRLLARLKPYSRMCRPSLLKEAEILKRFAGVHGVMQVVSESNYFAKKDPTQSKFHFLQPIFHHNFREQNLRPLSDDDLKIIMMDVAHGLNALHIEDKCHGDFHEGNLMFRMDMSTSRVKEAVICDLGLYSSSEQNYEAKRLINHFENLHIRSNKRVPSFIEKSKSDNYLTAAKILKAVNEHYDPTMRNHAPYKTVFLVACIGILVLMSVKIRS